jgi:CubicO group peptidase (beta-lactamase class C family)
MKTKLDQSSLDKIVGAVNQHKNIFGAVFYVSTGDRNIDLITAAGNCEIESLYYIASINKMIVASILLRLYAEGQINLNNKIAEYLSKGTIKGLHTYNGKDYSNDLTILHLLSHTSGLPCYLADKQADGRRVMDELEAGIDQAWPIEKLIQAVKTMKPHFRPGKAGKAKYSDTNYQILSLIIEKVTGSPIQNVLTNVFQELNLLKTYVMEDSLDRGFVPIYYKAEPIHLPLFFCSTHNDIVSTARDQMTFLKAFLNGHFLPKERFGELEQWNKVFFPFQYGIGIQKFHLPRILSPLQAVPEMVGHAGSTGSVAFYVPQKDIFITGTINQQAQPNIAFQTMIRILMSV